MDGIPNFPVNRARRACASLIASLRFLISFFKSTSDAVQNYTQSSTHELFLKDPVLLLDDVQPVLKYLALLVQKINLLLNSRYGPVMITFYIRVNYIFI